MEPYDTHPETRQDLEYRELDDGGVVYDTAFERIHTLNATAAYIWNLCDGTRSVSEIAEGLHQATGIHPDQALVDVVTLLVDFRNQGLLQTK
ncbi:MAG TPA: PqqD family protein [Acidobacteriota bacterium]|nr:PqqD family protein [Acidobacteriota bacterium]